MSGRWSIGYLTNTLTKQSGDCHHAETDAQRAHVARLAEWSSDEFRRLLRRAGVRRITLHDLRHKTLTQFPGWLPPEML